MATSNLRCFPFLPFIRVSYLLPVQTVLTLVNSDLYCLGYLRGPVHTVLILVNSALYCLGYLRGPMPPFLSINSDHNVSIVFPFLGLVHIFNIQY